MVKLVVVYGHPKDPEAFEKYYSETHMPLAQKIPCVKVEISKFIGTTDGMQASNYRMAELYFNDIEELESAMGSPDGQAAVKDIPNFATGGVDVAIAEV